VSASGPALDRLKHQWANLAALGAVFVAGVAAVFLIRFGQETAIRWSLPVAIVLAWFFFHLRNSLELNHPLDNPVLGPAFGAANVLTVIRAILTASLSGFLLWVPAPAADGVLDWLPGLVYLTAVVMDAADGHVARRTGNVTQLGAHLDTQVDALGLLLAGLLLIISAKAPWPYLGVGIGFYVLQAAVRLRRIAGRPVGKVPPRQDARWVAGCEMVFTALAMLPAFSPEATRPAAWIMILPIGISLVMDWCIVCGHAAENGQLRARVPALLGSSLARGVPLFLRAATATGWIMILFIEPAGSWEHANLPIRITAAAGIALCVLGVAARAAAMLLSLVAALCLVPSMPGSAASATLMATLSLMLTGAGHPRIWQPEDRFLMGQTAAPNSSSSPKK
jgi:CDP-diacylglycerol---glycerol-3-phosphate 3-phosphatidyltransferase